MTRSSLTIQPSMEQIAEFKTLGSKTIQVKGVILHGKTPIQIESLWRVDYECETIYFVASFLWTAYEKSPLPSNAVPDRHKRAVRRIGSSLFDKKRFDGLVLFETSDPSMVYSITMDKKHYFFTEVEDAKLSMLLSNQEGEVEKLMNADRKLQDKAQGYSEYLRYLVLGLMIKAVRGIEATNRLRRLLERGYEPVELEKIWRLTHGSDNVPETLRSIIYGKEETEA
ncbi:MAG: hypothetical protein ACTSWQ_07825 [Candidatus Thorarchaeota archaeon]